VYVWADGIHTNIRLEEDRQCLLVLMGATKDGRKELIAVCDGVRESAQSWRDLLLDLKRRGLAVAPKLAVGDGALGFWKALAEAGSFQRRHQRLEIAGTDRSVHDVLLFLSRCNSRSSQCDCQRQYPSCKRFHVHDSSPDGLNTPFRSPSRARSAHGQLLTCRSP